MKCPKCQTPLNKKAKFCSACGQPLSVQELAQEEQKVCFACHASIPVSAKFCNHCGSVQSDQKTNGVSVHNHYVTWNILPGQLALKIDEQTMAEYRSIRGLYIAPGTRALFFVNGNYVAALDSGKYPFRKFIHHHHSSDSPAINFLHSVADHISDGFTLLFSGTYLKKRNFYTVLLVKGADFPVRFEIPNITTNSIRSTIALDILCSISDLESFFATLLTDRKYISADEFANGLRPSVTAILNTLLKDTLPSHVSDNMPLIEQLKPQLEACLQTIYPYVVLKHIVRITADREEIEKLRRGKEDLYIGNEQLNQLQLQNELLNRAQSNEYTQELTEARSKVDFYKLMDKIDRDRVLNEDSRESFMMQLAAERELREAQTQADVDKALDKLCRDRLLSSETVDTLRRMIEFHAKEQDESHAGLLAIAVLRNRVAVDKETLDWDLEKANRIANDKLARDKVNFEWSQERNQKEEELRLQQEKAREEAAERRRLAEFELQQKLDAHKMDLLKQAQALREQNLQAAHERELALRKQTAEVEITKQKLAMETELEEQRLYLGMTAEQIMVANPRITPEAANAMAKKFEAQALATQNAATAELMQKHNDDLKELMRDQQQLTRDVLAVELKHSANALASKNLELERVQTASKQHEDRLLSGVQTATTSAASVLRTTPSTGVVFCTNCGKRHPASVKVCDACNTPLQ